MRSSRMIVDVTATSARKSGLIPFFLSFLGLLDLVGLIFEYLWRFFSPLYLLHIIQRLSYDEMNYSIDDQILSPATNIIFTRSKRTNQQICLKVWESWRDELYDTYDIENCTKFLLEGLRFNQKFARGVYLGIAHVEKEEGKTIQRGKLIRHPERVELNINVPYAVVMKCLKKYWRLDEQLCQDKLSTIEDIEFLARSIAKMHSELTLSPAEFGTTRNISNKLTLNKDLFDRALQQLVLRDTELSMPIDVEQYKWVSEVITQAYSDCEESFKRRYEGKHIKRCHGDLKSPNLWIVPRNWFVFRWRRKLLALDCIDFRPDFCHIDTLSDVAMLVVDIEARLPAWQSDRIRQKCENKPAEHFLAIYLRESREEHEKEPDMIGTLLEYYMTEKSMICACMSILYDEMPELGKRYIDVAVAHAHKLQQRFSRPTATEYACLQPEMRDVEPKEILLSAH